MLVAVLMATAVSTAPNALSLSGSGGMVLSIEPDPEGNALSGATMGGTRLQYDRAILRGWFFGAVAGFEHVWQSEYRQNHPPNANVVQAGLVVGGRWGESIRGGLRFATGFAYGMATIWAWESAPSGGQVHERRVDTPGWFVDFEGEVSAPLAAEWELFLGIPIILTRRFRYQGSDASRGEWWYGVPIIPFTGTLGLRHLF